MHKSCSALRENSVLREVLGGEGVRHWSELKNSFAPLGRENNEESGSTGSRRIRRVAPPVATALRPDGANEKAKSARTKCHSIVAFGDLGNFA